jgi:hypothetical protein
MHIVWWAGVSFVAEPTLLSLRSESGKRTVAAAQKPFLRAASTLH